MTDFVDLTHPLRVHVVNAGGAGMSAIATVLAGMGHQVTGVDQNDTVFVELLRSVGVTVEVSPRPHPLDDGVDLVAVSTATPDDHPNVVAARAAGTPVVGRAELLGAITRTRRTIAIAGTHGKTTTSAMLASALAAVGQAPSYVVGARITSLGRNAEWADGALLVVEGDESDGTFLGLDRPIAVVTNVEADHLEHWKGFAALIDGFKSFIEPAEHVIVCADDPVAAGLGRQVGALSYGTDPSATVRIVDHRTHRLDSSATIEHEKETLTLRLTSAPGLHNLRNATGALAGGIAAGVDAATMVEGLAAYRGVARRFELRGEAGGVTFVDSYDHLPAEVAAALDAASFGDWPRIVCVFQPHRYSRTEALADEFGTVFGRADLLVLTDVYSAGEAPRPGVDGRLVFDAVRASDPDRDLHWCPTLEGVVEFLVAALQPGDLCLTLGAGDLTTVPSRLMDRLAARP